MEFDDWADRVTEAARAAAAIDPNQLTIAAAIAEAAAEDPPADSQDEAA